MKRSNYERNTMTHNYGSQDRQRPMGGRCPHHHSYRVQSRFHRGHSRSPRRRSRSPRGRMRFSGSSINREGTRQSITFRTCNQHSHERALQSDYPPSSRLADGLDEPDHHSRSPHREIPLHSPTRTEQEHTLPFNGTVPDDLNSQPPLRIRLDEWSSTRSISQDLPSYSRASSSSYRDSGQRETNRRDDTGNGRLPFRELSPIHITDRQEHSSFTNTDIHNKSEHNVQRHSSQRNRLPVHERIGVKRRPSSPVLDVGETNRNFNVSREKSRRRSRERSRRRVRSRSRNRMGQRVRSRSRERSKDRARSNSRGRQGRNDTSMRGSSSRLGSRVISRDRSRRRERTSLEHEDDEDHHSLNSQSFHVRRNSTGRIQNGESHSFTRCPTKKRVFDRLGPPKSPSVDNIAETEGIFFNRDVREKSESPSGEEGYTRSLIISNSSLLTVSLMKSSIREDTPVSETNISLSSRSTDDSKKKAQLASTTGLKRTVDNNQKNSVSRSEKIICRNGRIDTETGTQGLRMGSQSSGVAENGMKSLTDVKNADSSIVSVKGIKTEKKRFDSNVNGSIVEENCSRSLVGNGGSGSTVGKRKGEKDNGQLKIASKLRLPSKKNETVPVKIKTEKGVHQQQNVNMKTDSDQETKTMPMTNGEMKSLPHRLFESDCHVILIQEITQCGVIEFPGGDGTHVYALFHLNDVLTSHPSPIRISETFPVGLKLKAYAWLINPSFKIPYIATFVWSPDITPPAHLLDKVMSAPNDSLKSWHVALHEDLGWKLPKNRTSPRGKHEEILYSDFVKSFENSEEKLVVETKAVKIVGEIAVEMSEQIQVTNPLTQEAILNSSSETHVTRSVPAGQDTARFCTTPPLIKLRPLSFLMTTTSTGREEGDRITRDPSSPQSPQSCVPTLPESSDTEQSFRQTVPVFGKPIKEEAKQFSGEIFVYLSDTIGVVKLPTSVNVIFHVDQIHVLTPTSQKNHVGICLFREIHPLADLKKLFPKGKLVNCLVKRSSPMYHQALAMWETGDCPPIPGNQIVEISQNLEFSLSEYLFPQGLRYKDSIFPLPLKIPVVAHILCFITNELGIYEVDGSKESGLFNLGQAWGRLDPVQSVDSVLTCVAENDLQSPLRSSFTIGTAVLVVGRKLPSKFSRLKQQALAVWIQHQVTTEEIVAKYQEKFEAKESQLALVKSLDQDHDFYKMLGKINN